MRSGNKLRIFRGHAFTYALCLGAAVVWAWIWHLAARSPADGLLFPLFKVERSVEDAISRRVGWAPKVEEFMFLGIDEPNYQYRFLPAELEEEPVLQLLSADYPWSREVWAVLLDKLMAAGARVVVFDLLFVSPGRGDEAFAEALARHEGRVVLAGNLNYPVDGSNPAPVWPADSLLDAMEDPIAAVGFANFFPDVDFVLRRSRDEFRLLTHTQLSLAAQMNRLSGWAPAADGGADAAELGRFRYAGPAGTYEHIPIYRVFSPDIWRENLGNGAIFKDKVVLVGPAAEWTQDVHRTSAAERMFGPEVHLHAAGAARHGAYVAEPSTWATWAAILGVGLLAGLMFHVGEHPWARVGLLAAGNAGGLALAFGVYSRWGYMPVLLPPLLALNTAGGLCLVQKFFATFLEKLRTRAMLERYVSRNFVREVLDRSQDFEESLGGVRRRCTMLFSDIRGFTTMTEGADSQALVTQLNEYLGEMVECVFRHEGTLDKFIGDAVMAVWGNVRVRTEREDAVSAVRTALDMLEALERLNAMWRARGVAELHIGIGLNHGEVIVGNMGAPSRKEFTVIGDAVNLASRLEGTTKEYGLALVVGERVAELAGGDFVVQPVDFIRVKGKTRPVAIFTVRRARTAGLAAYEAALTDYRAGRFAEARAGFEKAEVIAEAEAATGGERDPLPALYRKRCDAMLAEPPGPEWDGVFVMKTK